MHANPVPSPYKGEHSSRYHLISNKKISDLFIPHFAGNGATRHSLLNPPGLHIDRPGLFKNSAPKLPSIWHFPDVSQPVNILSGGVTRCTPLHLRIYGTIIEKKMGSVKEKFCTVNILYILMIRYIGQLTSNMPYITSPIPYFWQKECCSHQKKHLVHGTTALRRENI